MTAETMTSKERVHRYLTGRPVDRVPVAPVLDGYFAPRLMDSSSRECWRSPRLMAEAVCRCVTTFDHDMVVVNDALGDADNLYGCPITLDEDSRVPLFAGRAVATPADLVRLRPGRFAGGPGEETLRLVQQRLDGRRFILGVVTMPFELAFIVRGHDFLADLVADPEFADRTLEACLPLALARATALVEAGVDGIVFKDSLASASMISPAHYARFAFPWEKRVIATVVDSTWTVLHICRDAGPILERMARTGAHVLEIDGPCDVARALETVPAPVRLKGNIDAVAELQDGPIEELERRVGRLCRLARDTRRLIIGTGDSVPYDTPLERIHRLIDTARRHGRFSASPSTSPDTPSKAQPNTSPEEGSELE